LRIPESPGTDVKSEKWAIHEIGRRIGAHKIRTAPEMLTCYAFDATNMRALPLAVAFPDSTDDVRRIVSACFRAGVPVIPRGAGTGFAGGTVPLSGGVVISTEKLNRILNIDRYELTAFVQAGVVNAALQREAARYGLMFPPDPSSLEVATLGGNVAQDAGGPRAFKYGVTRDYVLGVEFVTWEGRVVEFDETHRVRRGWDPITTLMVSSEGTLGIMTKIRVRLIARPEHFRTVLAFFDTTVGAAAVVSSVLEGGVIPAAIELIDAVTMDCISKFVDVGIPAGAGCSLLIETDGREAEARESMSAVEKVLRRAGSIGFTLAESEDEREDLWRMRRSISPSLARIAPHRINEDVCVPRSKLPLLADAVGKLARKYRLQVPTFGHAGDGNLHVNVMLNRSDKDETKRAEALVTELFAATMDLGGTISGEHGIGVTKLQFLPDQLGPDGLTLQAGIKQAFDPRSLINPGKAVIRS
jgi:glycolate oxidase